MIHEALSQDIPHLVALDRKSYGEYGADTQYFRQKMSSKYAKILVSETVRKISEPMAGKWMHLIAFTTVSNFQDVRADSALLQAAENEAKNLGCALFCVPLSIDHPYAKNDVFGFWEKNGYRNAGTITWIASPTETIDCYFYTKPAS